MRRGLSTSSGGYRCRRSTHWRQFPIAWGCVKVLVFAMQMLSTVFTHLLLVTAPAETSCGGTLLRYDCAPLAVHASAGQVLGCRPPPSVFWSPPQQSAALVCGWTVPSLATSSTLPTINRVRSWAALRGLGGYSVSSQTPLLFGKHIGARGSLFAEKRSNYFLPTLLLSVRCRKRRCCSFVIAHAIGRRRVKPRPYAVLAQLQKLCKGQ